MTKTTCKICAVVWGVIALIGLVSFIGGMRSVNIGAFIFPLVFSIVFFVLYRRKQQ